MDNFFLNSRDVSKRTMKHPFITSISISIGAYGFNSDWFIFLKCVEKCWLLLNTFSMIKWKRGLVVFLETDLSFSMSVGRLLICIHLQISILISNNRISYNTIMPNWQWDHLYWPWSSWHCFMIFPYKKLRTLF